MQWKISQARAAAALLQRSTQYKINESKDNHNSATPDASRTNVPYTDAYVWGRFFEVESLAAYLRRKGIADLRVVANEPQSMNAVLSVCRAMTQHPLDITTTGGYPASHVQYVPFFPANLSKHN